MRLGFADNRAVVAIGSLVAVIVGLLVVWEVQANRMKADFVKALRAGRVQMSLAELRDKTWNERELATACAIKLNRRAGPQRALERLIHTRGGYTISSIQYSYQATITDLSTGIKHVFGYRRKSPGGWCWQTIHPDSAQRHIERRVKPAAAAP